MPGNSGTMFFGVTVTNVGTIPSSGPIVVNVSMSGTPLDGVGQVYADAVWTMSADQSTLTLTAPVAAGQSSMIYPDYTSFANDSGTSTLTATLVPGSSGGLPIVTGTSSVTINFSGCPSLCVGTVA